MEPFLDVDYCRFSNWGYKKPTRLWACREIASRPSVFCAGMYCGNVIHDPLTGWRHKKRLGGYMQEYSTRGKGRMPFLLIRYLIEGLLPGQGGETKQRLQGFWKCLPVWKEREFNTPPADAVKWGKIAN